jgi:uncharacterized protein with HEPN domain
VPPRDWRGRVGDILQAIAKIRRYVEGMSFESFCADDRTVDAVLRNITIIGEAARTIPDDVSAAHPGIPWQDMRDMRNVVVHVYFGVNNRILWDTIQKNLDPLVPVLKNLVEK